MAFNIEILAANLRKCRAQRNLTQQELADRLHVSAQSVSKWECSQSVPELDKLCQLADLLGVSVAELLESRPDSNRVLMGVDGGGTKTEFVLLREDGQLLARRVLEGSNPNLCGLESCLNIIKAGLDALLEPGMQLAGLFIGSAGYLTGGYGEQIKKALQRRYPQCAIACNSDAMNIMACGSSPNRCISAICGTGSVVYANEHGKLSRLGGGGYLLDLQGSGFDMGREVLRTALHERDGIGVHSAITELAEARLGGPVWDSVHKIYREGTAYIASFAPIAFEAYKLGDKRAEEILHGNAACLAGLIKAAAELYDCGSTVVLSGSIFTNKTVFLELLLQQLPAHLSVEVPTRPPVFGACRMACRLAGVDEDPFIRNFDEQYTTLKEDSSC